MAKGRKKEEKPLYRAVRFEVFPTPEELQVILRVSKNLSCIWNKALRERQECFEYFIRPIYDQMSQARKNNDEAKESLLRSQLRNAFVNHSITLYDQINALTAMRTEDAEYGSVPRNWQEETLDSLDGSFKSFLALRKNGDADAKPPRERGNKNGFYKIPGRSGFKVQNGRVILSFGKLGQTMVFPIPAFQQGKLNSATKLKKFELYRDERDMAKPGRFWISVAYEALKPALTPMVRENTVYLAIGASRIGIVSSKGELCLNLPRPDFHWKPNINAIEERLNRVTKGSRKWKRRMTARARMFSKLGHQQKQHGQYEVVQKLLSYGVHFVVTELHIRSKEDALADSAQSQRGGSPFGANWSAQNTGNIARLVQKLADKAAEHGGIIVKRRPPMLSVQERRLPETERKILIARKLREEFLAQQG